jgi:hypothetical protein
LGGAGCEQQQPQWDAAEKLLPLYGHAKDPGLNPVAADVRQGGLELPPAYVGGCGLNRWTKSRPLF